MIHTIVVEEDENGDAIIPLPKEVTEGSHPWLPGDEIIVRVNDSSTITVTNMSWFLRNEDRFG